MGLNHLSNDKSEPRESQALGFFQPIFRQATGFLEIRTFPNDKEKPIQRFFSIPSELDKAAAFAVGLREQVYYSAAPRTQQKGSADAVNTIIDLWVDGDDGALPWTSLAATNRIFPGLGKKALGGQ